MLSADSGGAKALPTVATTYTFVHVFEKCPDGDLMKKKRGLGDLIRVRRNARGISQRELGCSVGVTASHVAFVESGRRRPSHSLLFGFARSLQLDRQELFLTAYPELALLSLSRPQTESRQATWSRFVAGAGRYSVTPGEMAVLRKISRLGKISDPKAYFWILNSIRQSFAED
jgi:transcriptional regulator with XRE-family HTH domain